jgi:lipopolysaccharide export system permease protein
MSMIGAITVAMVLRAVGFFGVIAGGHTPLALVIPYITLFAAVLIGSLGIVRGVIIEPPAFVTNAINALLEGATKRVAKATEPAR